MADEYPRFTVAAVQAASIFFDRDKTIDKASQLIGAAGDAGAKIVGFPELFVPGHPKMHIQKKIDEIGVGERLDDLRSQP
jgi:predicted amidohydrolase